MASKMVAKVEIFFYSKYESQELPIAIKPIVLQVFYAMTMISDEMYAF